MTQGVHRTTANSKAGRKMRQAKGARLPDLHAATLTPDQRAWNAEVERRKAEKAKRS